MKTKTVYLYTAPCQTLVARPKETKFGLYKKVEKKCSLLWLNKSHPAVLREVNRFSQRLLRYIEDVRSEQTKYQAALDQHPQKETWALHQQTMPKRCYTVYLHNPLTIALGQAIELTDGLFLLLVALDRLGDVLHRRTRLYVSSRLLQRLYRLMGQMNQLSMPLLQDRVVPQAKQMTLASFSKYANNSISGVCVDEFTKMARQ